MSLPALAAIMIFGQTARADDTSTYNWTGCYLGAHLGYVLANGDSVDTPLHNGSVETGSVIPSSLSPNPDGVTGGGQVGYNLQRGCFLFGVEADISGSTASGADTAAPIRYITPTGSESYNPGSYITSHVDTDWFGTLRARLGYIPSPRLLFYGTGGLAYGYSNFFATEAYPGNQYLASTSGLQAGWVAGGGVEYAIGNHWSVKAEYLYCDLGTKSMFVNSTPSDPGYASIWSWDTAFQVVNLGVNFKF
jgi:outer membrane immunogenic protein